MIQYAAFEEQLPSKVLTEVPRNVFFPLPPAPVTPPPPAEVTLYTGMQAHWKLNEASGNRLDSVGDNDLVPSGSPQQVEGKPESFGTQFVPGTSDLLQCPHAAGLYGGGSFTMAGWVMFDATDDGTILGKWESGNKEYRLGLVNGMLVLDYSADGVAVQRVTSISLTVETGVWYFIVITHYYIVSAIYLNMSYSSGLARAIFQGTSPFRMGGDGDGSSFAGRLCSWSIWNRLLTTAEMTSLYNEGIGLAYDNMTTPEGNFGEGGEQMLGEGGEVILPE